MARAIDADAFREWWLENGENEYVYDTNAFLESIDNWATFTSVEGGEGNLSISLSCAGCMYLNEDVTPCSHCIRSESNMDYYRRKHDKE